VKAICSFSLPFLALLVSIAALGCSRNPEQNYLKSGDRLAGSSDVKRLEAALVEYKKALVLNPESIAIKEKVALVNGKLGKELVRQEMWNEAIVKLEESLEIKPNIANNRYYLALAYVNKARIDSSPTSSIDRAIEEYKKAIGLEPESRYYTGLAIAYYHKDRKLIDQAIAACREAIAKDPQYPHAHAVLGRMLAEKGELEAALGYYRRAALLAEKTDRNEAAGYYDALGDIYSLMGNSLRAKEARDKASELRAKVRRTRRGLGPAPTNRR